MKFKPLTTIGLYPVIDSSEWVEKLLSLGVKCIQLRIKNAEQARLIAEIRCSVELANKHNAILFVNDYWQLAIELGAEGVHLGQEDLDTADLNAIHRAGLYLGISTHCLEEVTRAQLIQPSYMACGPIFTTTSKEMRFEPQGVEKLKYWREQLDCPLVAIGGINLERLPAILDTDVEGIALISAITKASDPSAMTRQLLQTIQQHQTKQYERYTRQMALPQIGFAGQQKLNNARVLCVGLGGLGSPLSLYLTAAGIGQLGIMDDDTVSETNLHRQVLYNTADVDKKKAEMANQRLSALNPTIKINYYTQRVTQENIAALVEEYDIVADGSDNFATRYLIHRECFKQNKPYVYASANQFLGHCSIFKRNQTPCLECLFPLVSQEDTAPTIGVLGTLPGILGTLQATEIIKWIMGIGESIAGSLLIVDLLNLTFRQIKLIPNSECKLCSIAT